MRRGKLHYNADRWYAYCADRMGWQVGQWIDKFTDGGGESRPATRDTDDSLMPRNYGNQHQSTSRSGLCGALRCRQQILGNPASPQAMEAGVAPGPFTFNGNAADAATDLEPTAADVAVCAEAGTGTPLCADAAAPTPQVWRTRK